MHEVTNQPPPLEPYNLLHTDRALGAALIRENAAWAAGEDTRRVTNIRMIPSRTNTRRIGLAS